MLKYLNNKKGSCVLEGFVAINIVLILAIFIFLVFSNSNLNSSFKNDFKDTDTTQNLIVK